MFDDGERGVIIADGRCGVRLRVLGQASESWYPIAIEVRAGPFSGSFLDEAYGGFQQFAAGLPDLYNSLRGEAIFGQCEKLSLRLVGDGRGGVRGFVEIDDFNSTVCLKFEIQFDQTYLPAIIEAIRREV